MGALARAAREREASQPRTGGLPPGAPPGAQPDPNNPNQFIVNGISYTPGGYANTASLNGIYKPTQIGSFSQAGTTIGSGPSFGGTSGGLAGSEQRSGNNTTGTGTRATTTTTNTANADPTLQKFLTTFDQRYQQLKGLENKPLTSDTNRMIDRSTSAISDQAAGLQSGLDESLARRGVGGGPGIAAGAANSLAQNAQRLQAGASADILMKQQDKQDTLDVTRMGMTNGLLGLGLQGALAPAQLGLQQQGLNLQQQQAQQQAEFERRRLEQADADRRMREMLAAQQMSTYTPPPPVYGGYPPPTSTYRPPTSGLGAHGSGGR